MSLVDSSYGSDDEEDVPAPEGQQSHAQFRSATQLLQSTAAPLSSGTVAQAEGGVAVPSRSFSTGSGARVLLPDVSELLGPGASHSTATASVERKRHAVNGSGPSMPHSKLPRGNLQPARVRPDTAGGLLTPPQLRGRSNVATEDLDKIFSRRHR